MKPTPQSTSIATSINNTLLNKALVILSRRQILYKNMNLYSLEQLSKVIQQINQQQSLKIDPTSITQSDDHQTRPYDNMMSMSEVKLMLSKLLCETQKDNKTLITMKSIVTNPRKDTISKEKVSFLDLLQNIQSSQDYITNYYSISKQQEQEQSTQIQAFRIIKKQQQQQLLLRRQSQQKKKPPIPINLNNQRVVYGYDSKLTKLQKIKQRKSITISQMDSSIISLQESPQIKKQKNQSLLKRRVPVHVTNKVNITEKQAEQQQQKLRQKQRRTRKYQTSTIVQQPPTINIRMNPQSHKETQQAIAIKQRGVKISIDKRQFSVDRYNPSNKINRRLTRAEYMQIRANQQMKQGHYRQIEKGKTQSEGRLKTDYVKQEKSSSNSGKKYKISFSTFYNLPKKDQSTIFTHNLQAKTQMLKQVKDKPFLFQTIRENSSSVFKQQQLSDVDRYNLLYLKYKGNPPQQIQQNLLKALKSQQKMLRQAKSSLSTYSNQTRLIKKRTNE